MFTCVVIWDFVDDHIETGHYIDPDDLSTEKEDGLAGDESSHILFENEVEEFEEILNEAVDIGENKNAEESEVDVVHEFLVVLFLKPDVEDFEWVWDDEDHDVSFAVGASSDEGDEGGNDSLDS